VVNKDVIRRLPLLYKWSNHPVNLADVFTDCQNKFDNDKYQFLSLLDETLNLDEIVPVSFVSHFHTATGRPTPVLSNAQSSVITQWLMGGQ